MHTIYYIIKYLKHRITATNQHGVHSPFVYAYVTKCLYKKSKYKASKSETVALKSISYFKIDKLKVLSSGAQLTNLISKELDLKTTDTASLDFIYADTPSSDLIANHKGQLHNDSMLLVANIHHSKRNTDLWVALKQNDNVMVSVDMFYCGALFFRKEQMKEHFKIRI